MDILVGIIPSVVNMKGAKVSTNFIQHSEQKQNLVIRLLQNHCKSLWKFCTILQFWRTFWETHKIWKKNLPHGFHKSADLLSKRQNHEEDFFKLCVLLKKSELYIDIVLTMKNVPCFSEILKGTSYFILWLLYKMDWSITLSISADFLRKNTPFSCIWAMRLGPFGPVWSFFMNNVHKMEFWHWRHFEHVLGHVTRFYESQSLKAKLLRHNSLCGTHCSVGSLANRLMTSKPCGNCVNNNSQLSGEVRTETLVTNVNKHYEWKYR